MLTRETTFCYARLIAGNLVRRAMMDDAFSEMRVSRDVATLADRTTEKLRESIMAQCSKLC